MPKDKFSSLDILLVNPQLEFPADTSGRSGLYRSKEYLLNGGLLSVATHLKDSGYEVMICDLTTTDDPIKALEGFIVEFKPKFVGISNQSCHSYLSTQNCAMLVKSISKETKVVVGGLHASGIPEWVLGECKHIDAVVVGEGELVLADLVQGTNNSIYEKINLSRSQFFVRKQKTPDLNKPPGMDYTLYPDYRLFVPYAEESRGCSYNCEYCIAPNIHKCIRIKDPEVIFRQVSGLRDLYGSEGFHFFMEANNFGVNHKKTAILAGLLAGSEFSWRTEARADTFPDYLLDPLTEAGLRVLDIGLESGSPEILLRMNKTKDPKKYLESGIRIAEKIAQNGKCLLKFNVMLYYGETQATVGETREYLRLINSICPMSIGIGPVRMEPGSRIFNATVRHRDLSRFSDTFWGRVHCYPLDLSQEISFKDADAICRDIAQEFQTSWAYYEAKRHSQLPYSITYEEFMRQSDSIPDNEKQWIH